MGALRRLVWAQSLLVLALAACSGAREEGDPAASSELERGTIPTYTSFQLRARSTEIVWDPAGASQIPEGSYIKNHSPSINDRGDVSINFRGADGHHQVWKNGQVVYRAEDPAAFIFRTSLDAEGDVAFDVTQIPGSGVWVFSQATKKATFLTAEPFGAEAWTNLRLLDGGRVGSRPSAADRHYVGVSSPDGFTRYAVETSMMPSSPYAYLFTPAFDSAGRAALKVLLASGGNEIRVMAPPAAPRVVVRDREADPSSPYTKFDNGVAFNDRGQIAFIATVDGRRGVFRAGNDGEAIVPLALEGQGGVAEIAYFNPAIDGAGNVFFRGFDAQRRNTIWIADGTALKPLITAGDKLPSDHGDALALPETGFDPANKVVFGGGIAVNAAGDVVFLAAVAQRADDGTLRRLGTGVYVAVAAR